jgi:hypothetical protein
MKKTIRDVLAEAASVTETPAGETPSEDPES